jgi:hypothetical protein
MGGSLCLFPCVYFIVITPTRNKYAATNVCWRCNMSHTVANSWIRLCHHPHCSDKDKRLREGDLPQVTWPVGGRAKTLVWTPKPMLLTTGPVFPSFLTTTQQEIHFQVQPRLPTGRICAYHVEMPSATCSDRSYFPGFCVFFFQCHYSISVLWVL